MNIYGTCLKTIVVAAVGITCSAAYADSPSSAEGPRSSLVRYSDLDLNRQQDVAKLYMRITSSADQLCGPRSLTGIHYKWAEYTNCYNETVAHAVASVAYPSLSAYYRQHSSDAVAREISMAR